MVNVNAEQLGVSRQAICLWEAEKREIKATALRKIADILKINVNELIRVVETDLKEVDFELKAPQAKTVYVVGDFTAWEKKIRLRRFSSGLWKKRLALRSGRYEYKFVVDGEWRVDPVNDQTVYNSMGTLNSVKEL
jgi:1,4-alpha-glucan branching enzyme